VPPRNTWKVHGRFEPELFWKRLPETRSQPPERRSEFGILFATGATSGFVPMYAVPPATVTEATLIPEELVTSKVPLSPGIRIAY
jgi:hypothetical protein